MNEPPNLPPGFRFRPIEARDDEALARLIREVMAEFGTVGEGYSVMDAEADGMYEAYTAPRSWYWVLEKDGEVVGGGGIAPLKGAEAEVCELRKMYFRPEARGKGLGKILLGMCLGKARTLGFRTCYLETVPQMEAANALYRKFGFRRLDHRLGNTGHCACQCWYAREL